MSFNGPQLELQTCGVTAMATRRALLLLALFSVAMVECADNCDSAASTLLPCYPYVTGPDVKPPADCCGGLGTLNTNSAACLCQLITQLNGSGAADPSVNITKAFNLPRDCAITLKTSDCPALANLPLAPLAATPTQASPGPTAAGPGSGVPDNHVSKLLPTSSTFSLAIAVAGALLQTLLI